MQNELQKEEMPLIRTEPSATIYLKTVEYALCLIAAFPTAVLNGLAAISGTADKAGSLNTVDDLKNLLDESSTAIIAYGVIAFVASEVVFFFLNKSYLLPSINPTLDLFRRTYLILQNTLCRRTVNSKDTANIFLQNILFFWSILTSLIFGEVSSEALSFFGLAGQISGFSLTLIVCFATRFAGAKAFFKNLYDTDFQLKKAYIEKLQLLNDSNIAPVAITHEKTANDALIEFLNNIDENWNILKKNQKKVICLSYIAPTLSYSLIAITVLPIMVGFLPSSIQGLEQLTRQEIGEQSNYQNPASFSLGVFITTLTLFFFEMNIKELPKKFLLTLLSIEEKITDNNIKIAAKLIFLTILALVSSYLASIGFKFIADTALANGYLSYLGPRLSQTIPYGLFIGVMAMLWSHLQQRVNQQVIATDNSTLPETNQIDLSNAQSFINLAETDLSSLSELKKNTASWSTYFKRQPNTENSGVGVSLLENGLEYK